MIRGGRRHHVFDYEVTGHAEIGQSCSARHSADQDVLGLDVAVDNAGGVRMVQARGDFANERQECRRRAELASAQERAQVAHFHVGQHQERIAPRSGLLAPVEYGQDVRVI
jgi:hypothetical protein